MSDMLAIVGFWLFIGLVAGVIEFFITALNQWDDFIHPWSMYRRWKCMNWFGCWSIFTVLSIISPYMFIIKLFVFLFTVGRGVDEDTLD